MVDWVNRENNNYSQFQSFLECINHVCNNDYSLLDDNELFCFYLQMANENANEQRKLLDDHLNSIKNLKLDF